MKEMYLIIAYMAIWIGLGAYVAALARRQRKLSIKIDVLNKRLKTEEG
jgi:CcmD family protein